MKKQSDFRAAFPALVKRNVTLFFKDKGTFFTSLITPIILLVLYATFLYDVYKSSFLTAFQGMQIEEELLNGLVGGLLLSSLLAVSTVTVSFCANLFIVQDKITGARADFNVSPVKSPTLYFSYYTATLINGLIISLVATLAGFVYLAFVGWYLSVLDILALFLDVFLLTSFGTALSSLICAPLKSQGQLSAVGTIVSAGYGFICGAYMPISQFSKGLQTVLSFFPGTYGTSLVRNHALSGVFLELENKKLPAEVITELKKLADCELQFFGASVEVWQSYVVIIGAILLLIGGFIAYAVLSSRKKTKRENQKGRGQVCVETQKLPK